MLPYALSLTMVQSNFALHDGDRVLFYGDSITDNSYYPQMVENYTITRFPGMKIRFMNYGWSGDRVTGGGGGNIDLRLKRDVYPFKPTVVTIMLGMNDGNYQPWSDATFSTYSTGYEHLVDGISKATGARMTFIGPSPYDDVTRAATFPGGYNAVLIRFSEFLNGLALKKRSMFVDFNRPFVDMLTKANALDANGAQQLIRDRVHPDASAHLSMGAALLKGWGAPGLVSRVEIDAVTNTVHAENATVQLRQAIDLIAWREKENALPLFLDRTNPRVLLVLKSAPIMDLNQELLLVRGLSPGKYTLTIDGEELGNFNAEQLSSGINLAEMNTPMMRQSAAVAQLTAQRQVIRQTLWRVFGVMLDPVQLKQQKQAVAAAMKLEDEIVEKQHKTAQPVWHIYALKRAFTPK